MSEALIAKAFPFDPTEAIAFCLEMIFVLPFFHFFTNEAFFKLIVFTPSPVCMVMEGLLGVPTFCFLQNLYVDGIAR